MKTSHVDCDGILAELGAMGRYQVLHYVFLVIIVVLTSSAYLSYVFNAGQLEYRCLIPGCDGLSGDGGAADEYEFSPPWVHNAVPFDEHGKPERCLRFQYVADDEYRCDEFAFNQSIEVECDEFVFETDEVNIVNEFNITCDGKDWQLAIIGSSTYIAGLIALPICATISDKYGRRPVLIATIMLSGICGLAKSFSVDYSMFAAMEFITALVSSGTYMTLYVVAIEFAAPSKRVFSGALTSASYSFSQAIPGVVAMWVPNFRTQLQILYTPTLLLLPLIWLIPESVRWLVSAGKLDEANALIMRAAEMNQVQLSAETIMSLEGNRTGLPSNIIESTSAHTGLPSKSNKYASFVKSKILCVRLSITVLCWFLIKFIYYGMTIQSVSLAGNKYVNYILVNLVEIPATFLNSYLVNRFGRKRTLFVGLVLTGVACVVSEFIPKHSKEVLLIVFIVGKCCATIAFTTLYLISSELWPTLLRHSMMNACMTVGTLGSVIAPFTTLLLHAWSGLPLLCFAGSAIVSGVLVLQLPETLNTQLPDTVKEAESLGTNYRTNI